MIFFPQFLFSLVFFFLFKYFIVYAVRVVPIFPPLKPSPSPSPIPTPLPMTMGHACMFSTNPFTFFQPAPTSPDSYSCQSVLYFYVPGSLNWLIYFARYIPLISEIIWYLCFTNCLISFSIIACISIYAVTKGKNPFFFTAV